MFAAQPKTRKQALRICEMMVFLKEVMIKYGPLAYYGVKILEFEEASKSSAFRSNPVHL